MMTIGMMENKGNLLVNSDIILIFCDAVQFREAQTSTFSNKLVWVVIANKIKMMLTIFDG